MKRKVMWMIVFMLGLGMSTGAYAQEQSSTNKNKKKTESTTTNPNRSGNNTGTGNTTQGQNQGTHTHQDTLETGQTMAVPDTNRTQGQNQGNLQGQTTGTAGRPGTQSTGATLPVPMIGQTGTLALTDADILQIFVALNNGEVMTSQPVQNRLSQNYREFAGHVAMDHSTALQRARDLGQNASMQPNDNLISAALQTMAQGVATRLQGLEGKELDQQFVTSQIALHQQALDMLDFTLIPNAKDEQLRSMLQESRAKVAKHLEEVQHLYHHLD